jgi:hypothetical protein
MHVAHIQRVTQFFVNGVEIALLFHIEPRGVVKMGEFFLISSRDMVLFAIPFVSLILISQLRLNGIAKPPRGSASRSVRRCGMDLNGEPILRDPDGRLSGRRNRRK